MDGRDGRKAVLSYQSLDDQTLDFLADRFRKSVHDLVGAVLRLDVHGRILGRSPTAQEAARVLADALTEHRRRVGVRAIQEQVADFFTFLDETSLQASGKEIRIVGDKGKKKT